jgi:hypothetical protein
LSTRRRVPSINHQARPNQRRTAERGADMKDSKV